MSSRAKGSIKKATTTSSDKKPAAEHLTVPEVRRSLSLDEQRVLLQLSVHDSEEMKTYIKPHEGFERIAPLTLRRLGNYPDVASALRLDVPALESDLARASTLAEQEDIAYRLHRRALENRIYLQSEAYRALLKLNRFLQSSDDVELQRDFAELSEWVAARSDSGRKREPEGAEPAEQKAE